MFNTYIVYKCNLYYLLFIIFIFKIILGKGKNYESKQLTNIYCKKN